MDETKPKLPAWVRWATALAIVGLIVNYAWEQLTLPRIAPVQFALQIVDEHGAPAPYADVSVTQDIDIGRQWFCLSISVGGTGGRDCTKYKRVPVFLGKADANGKLSVTVRYANRIFIEVVTACQKNQDGYLRRDQSLTVAEWDDIQPTRKVVAGPTDKNGSVDDCKPDTPPTFYN